MSGAPVDLKLELDDQELDKIPGGEDGVEARVGKIEQVLEQLAGMQGGGQPGGPGPIARGAAAAGAAAAEQAVPMPMPEQDLPTETNPAALSAEAA